MSILLKEYQTDNSPVDDGQTVIHEDFGVGFVGFVEQVLFKLALFLERWVDAVVIIFGQYSVAVVVHEDNPLDRVQTGPLKQESKEQVQ